MQVMYLLVISVIAGVSFYFYAAFNDAGFNSDHAAHALMANDFDWEHGTFYWGQNRLGSFLPWIASYPVKWFGWHPLYVTGTLNYLFLLAGFFLLARYLRTYIQKILLAIFIFWPLTGFHFLVLIGHPYAAQLFLLALAALFFERAGGWLLAGSFGRVLLHITLFFVAFTLSVWVSELSGMLAVLFLLLALFDKEILKEIACIWHEARKYFVLGGIYLVVLILASYRFYVWTKSNAPVDPEYDRIFIDTGAEISQQWKWMMEDITFRLGHTDKDWSWTVFYYALLLAGVLLFVQFIQRVMQKQVQKPQLALVLCLLTGCIMLFFSVWNYRFSFDVKYFTPLYVLLVFYYLYSVSYSKKWIGRTVLVLSCVSALGALADNKRVLGMTNFNVAKELSPFSKLPEGGMIAGYWLAYRVAAFGPDNLLAVPIDVHYVRNAHQVEEVLAKERIYVIRNGFLPDSLPLPDTLRQFNQLLIKTSADTTVSSITFASYKVKK